MSRTIVDAGLRSWEAFASTGRYGFAPHARLVFHCTTDPAERPRAYEIEGDKSDVEALVATAPDAQLRELLETAQPLD
jgi:hypothetical protein